MTAEDSLSPAISVKLRVFERLVRERFGERLRELVLFGSRARGDAGEDSDVDVLVVIDDLSHDERCAVFDLGYEADSTDRESWVGLSPLPYSTAQARELRGRERQLFADIDRDGVKL